MSDTTTAAMPAITPALSLEERVTAAAPPKIQPKTRGEISLATFSIDKALSAAWADQWDEADRLLLEASMRIERAREGIRWLQQQRGQS